MVDTTFGTNKYEQSLINVCSIDNRGRIMPIANGFLNNEKKESFIWFFEQLKSLVKITPKVK